MNNYYRIVLCQGDHKEIASKIVKFTDSSETLEADDLLVDVSDPWS